MNFLFSCRDTSVFLPVSTLFVAGWTGRNTDAVQHHIDELAILGIKPPSATPLYYRVSHALMTQDPAIQVLGGGTSGEVEPLLIRAGEKNYLGLASDHTDRDLEAVSVAASKQACAKPVAREVWNFDAVKGHLDQISLRCWIEEEGQQILYQDGTLANIRPLQELCEGAGFTDGSAMLCGTLGAIGGVRPAHHYRMEMSDPVLGQTLTLSYAVDPLPIVE